MINFKRLLAKYTKKHKQKLIVKDKNLDSLTNFAFNIENVMFLADRGTQNQC